MRTILITGASSGIGRELALQYAAPDVRLLLTGRDSGRIEEIAAACRAAGAAADGAVLDVVDRPAMARRILAWDDAGAIDLAIANAGVSGERTCGPDRAEEAGREILRINVDGVLNTVCPLIPRMRARRGGQLALMGSIAGFRGLPSAPFYSMSKNAVRAYAEALRPTLAREGVRVNLIAPGFVRTPLTDRNDFRMPFLMDTVRAARIIRSGLERDLPVVAFPWQMYWQIRIVAALPRRLGDALIAWAVRRHRA